MTVTTTAVTGSAAGTYAITVANALSTNYSLNLQNGTLTISKASLTAYSE